MAGTAKVREIKAVDRSLLVDEFGRLDSELAALKSKIERRDQLKKQIQSWYENEDAGQEFTAYGVEFDVEVSPKANERKIISISEIKARLGLRRFLTLCKFPLGELDKIIAPAEQSSLVSVDRTGHRTVKAIRKYSGEQAA